MRHAPRALLAGGLGFAASLLVACGGGGGVGLLAGDQASSLNSSLDQLPSTCATSSELESVSNAVANLPPSIDKTLRENLRQGASTIAQLASHCQSAKALAPKTTSTASTPSAPTATTTTSVPAPTDTNPPPPPSTSTPVTPPGGQGSTTTGPPSGGAGLGGGSGGGGGGGGPGGPGPGARH